MKHGWATMHATIFSSIALIGVSSGCTDAMIDSGADHNAGTETEGAEAGTETEGTEAEEGSERQAMMLGPAAEDGTPGEPLGVVTYKVIDGRNIVGGDIVVTDEQLAELSEEVYTTHRQGLTAHGNERYRWSNGVVPYVIDSSMPDKWRIREAVLHWENKTSLDFVERSGQSDYIRFTRNDDDYIGLSYVGRIGGAQKIWLGDKTNVGTAVHEIGHAVGLFHEHNRPGRDDHIRVVWDNIDSTYQYAFEIETSAVNQTGYDAHSVMHYHAKAFSKNGGYTLVYRDSGSPVPSDQNRLSDRDVAGIAKLYGSDEPLSGNVFYLKNSLSGGSADLSFMYGQDGDVSLACDWDGNGTDTVGIVRGNRFYLKNSNSGGSADIVFTFGHASDTPLCGDWDGDGKDTVGIWRAGTFHLRNSNSGGHADHSFRFGTSTDHPIVGDWNGDGIDTVGIRREATFYFRNSHSGGNAESTFRFGRASDQPVIGDWDADGVDTVGVRRGNSYYLNNSNTGGNADITFRYGIDGDRPLTGDWDGDGQDTVGINR